MSQAFRNYQRSYNGKHDLHFGILRKLRKVFESGERVLYPGCHRHITPSLVFQDVTYVDMDRKVSDVYRDEYTKQWLTDNKDYSEDVSLRYVTSSYEGLKKHLDPDESVDVLISLSAGIVSKDCLCFLKEEGIFFVNDSHSDAKVAFLEPTLQLEGYYNDDKQEWISSAQELEELFLVEPRSKRKAKGLAATKISKEQVEEAIRIGSKSKRSFVMKREPMFYVFRKRSTKEASGNDKDDAVNKESDVDNEGSHSTKKRRSTK